MWRRCRAGWVAAATVMGLLAAACGGSSSPPLSSAPAGPPVDGGSLTVGEYSAITSLDPTVASGSAVAGSNELGAVYGALMRYNATTGAYTPYMAASLTHDPTYTTWTLGLRPGMVFSDGTPYDAQAVIENLTRDKKTLTNTAAGELALVQSMSAPNATTVTIELSASWPDFPFALADKSGDIAAPTYLAELAAGHSQATAIGAGPFVVRSFRPGEELTLVPNTRYSLAPPHLASLEFVPIAGGPATYQSFQTGQLGVAVLNDAVTQKQLPKSVLRTVTPYDLGGMLLLNNNPEGPGGKGSVFSNPQLRQAVAMAIDPQVLSERLDQGAGEPSNLLFPPGSRWYYHGEAGVPYDPVKAKQMVAEVRQQTGWNGTAQLVCNNSPADTAFPTAIEAMLGPIGIHVHVDNSMDTTGEIDQVLVKQQFDMACFAYNASDTEPYPALHNGFYSTSFSNRIGYKSAQYDAALDAFRSAATPSAQQAAVEQLVAAWNATVPSVNFNVNTQLSVIRQPYVQGLGSTVNGVVLFDHAWVAKK